VLLSIAGLVSFHLLRAYYFEHQRAWIIVHLGHLNSVILRWSCSHLSE